MRPLDLNIAETRFYDGKLTIKLQLPENYLMRFGQYLLAATPGDLLPSAIFPQSLQHGEFISTPDVPSHWRVGDLLHIRGPLGIAFDLPVNTRRLVCFAARDACECMLPLIHAALGQRCSVVACTDKPCMHLPDQVEIQPRQNLNDLTSWADLIMLDISIAQITEYKDVLSVIPKQVPVFAFLHTPMPCGGFSDCGLCSVITIQGVKRVCQDGPVFDWQSLGSAK